MSELVNENKEPKKKAVSWRKHRKRSRLYYKVIHQSPRPFLPLYIIECFLAITLEVIRKLLVIFKQTMGILAILILIVGIAFIFKFYPTIVEYNDYAAKIIKEIDRDDFSINESTKIYDKDKNLIAIVKEDSDQEYIEYDDIPEDIIDAFVAIEDRTFWTNDGVDYQGILRVGLRFLASSGDEVHGASTITQQLVKNTYLSSEVSIERKVKEILISRAMTKQFTKRDIMEFYCNDICFANGIYGISGASKAYFNKPVSKLSLAQCAYLCAIPNRPSYYDPYEHPENALDRKDKILRDMLDCGYIDEYEYAEAINEEIHIVKPDSIFNDYETTIAVDSAIKYLLEMNGFEFKYEFETNEDYKEYHDEYDRQYELMRHKLYTGGYEIYTSLDSELCEKFQTIVDEKLAFDESVDDITGLYQLQGALTCIDNETGKIVAVVGGRSQESDNITYSFNRAYQSYRQPGSSFKPIAVYTPALMSEYRYTPNSLVYNISVTEAKKKGADVQKMTGSAMTLRSGVEQSKNGVAWQIFDKITPKYGMSFITKMKFQNICPDDYYNSSSLGGLTYGVTTVEMASAYSALSNHGDFKQPTCIISMLDKNGKEIFKDYNSYEVYTDKEADDMVDILKGVLTRGTAAKLGWSKASKVEAFAKTGTTNGSKDGWLCGATPYYSIAVWVGYDTPKTLSNLYGATYPGQIWKDCMLLAIDSKDEVGFVRNDTDESYTSNKKYKASDSYYSYLEGRDDSEILSGNYTVGDYRNDRVIGEDVFNVINQMNAVDLSQPDGMTKVIQYYQLGQSITSTIYSNNYKAEVTLALDTAYHTKIGQ